MSSQAKRAEPREPPRGEGRHAAAAEERNSDSWQAGSRRGPAKERYFNSWQPRAPYWCTWERYSDSWYAMGSVGCG